jgi:hypothetical protein
VVRRQGEEEEEEEEEKDGLLLNYLCHIEYCPAEGGGLLKIVSSDESRTVLDVVAADDVIGASVDVGLIDGAGGDDDDGPARRSSASPSTSPSPSDELVDRQASATIRIYCYPKRRPAARTAGSVLQRILGRSPPAPAAEEEAAAGPLPRVPAHRSYRLAPVEDLGAVRALVRSIRDVAQNQRSGGPNRPPPQPPRRSKDDEEEEGSFLSRARREKYLVLVNPASGTGQAPRAARTVVVPMLDQAGIESVVVETEYAGHAADLLSSRQGQQQQQQQNRGSTDPGPAKEVLTPDVTGILVVGGDGVFHEVVNALSRLRNGDDKKGPGRRKEGPCLLSRLKLGMIPCGTGSGLAATVAHASGEECSVVSCCYLAWYACPSTAAEHQVSSFSSILTLVLPVNRCSSCERIFIYKTARARLRAPTRRFT